jgi:glycine oxidase
MSDTYDAVIIGGGIIGATTAWRLAQGGRQVALLERGRIGGEASSAAGGILVPENSPGLDPALLEFWKVSHAMYPEFVAETRELTGHAFEYRVPGRIVAGFDDADIARLRERHALQAAGGIRASWVSAAETREAEPSLSPDVRGALFFPDHGLVDNPRFTRALGDAARLAGATVVENCVVTGLTLNDERVRGVETAIGSYGAAVVVNCAGSWSGRVDSRVRQPVRPAKGQMLAVDRGSLVMRHMVEGGGIAVVPRADGRTQLGATVHDVGFDKDVIASDVAGMIGRGCRLVPGLTRARFVEAWAGLRPMCPDRLPLIGPDPAIRGLYWATGHYTMGILGAPATARAIADLVQHGATDIPVQSFGAERFLVTSNE